jgi:hypothetical protein
MDGSRTHLPLLRSDTADFKSATSAIPSPPHENTAEFGVSQSPFYAGISKTNLQAVTIGWAAAQEYRPNIRASATTVMLILYGQLYSCP